MADERETGRIEGARPRPTEQGLVGVRPVEPVRQRGEVVETYRRVERRPGPPEPTDAQHVLVRQVMSRPARVLEATATLGDAADVMKAHDIRHVPIVENGILVGLITQADLAARVLAGDARWRRRPVTAAMTRDVVTLQPTHTLFDAASLLIGSRHSGAPVVAPPGRPVGFLSSRDVLKVLVQRAPLTLWV